MSSKRRPGLVRPSHNGSRSAGRKLQPATACESLEPRRLLAILTWVGDVDANWGTNVAGNTNWSPNAIPTVGDRLIFPAGAPRVSNNNLGNLSLSQISINGVGAGNRRYEIGGNAASINSTGQPVVFNAGPDQDGLGPKMTVPLTLQPSTVVNTGAAAGTLGDVVMAGTVPRVGICRVRRTRRLYKTLSLACLPSCLRAFVVETSSFTRWRGARACRRGR
jgi:hypothetical protein